MKGEPYRKSRYCPEVDCIGMPVCDCREPEGCWCTDCKQECRLVEETFDYAGTHCTHGKPGTHHTGNYVSDCCGAEYTYENPLTCPECGSNHTIQCHHEGNGVVPECDYLECEDCNHQWGHE